MIDAFPANERNSALSHVIGGPPRARGHFERKVRAEAEANAKAKAVANVKAEAEANAKAKAEPNATEVARVM